MRISYCRLNLLQLSTSSSIYKPGNITSLGGQFLNCSGVYLLCIFTQAVMPLWFCGIFPFQVLLFLMRQQCQFYCITECCRVSIAYGFYLIFWATAMIVQSSSVIVSSRSCQSIHSFDILWIKSLWVQHFIYFFYLLIRRKARVRVPDQTSKRNTKSISSAISSQQISGKNFESKIKLPWKVSQKSVIRSRL